MHKTWNRIRAGSLILALLTGPALAADDPAVKPQGKANTGAGSTTGVGNSPIEGTGETGNGRVMNGTAGSGGTAPPGTLDKSSAGSVESK